MNKRKILVLVSSVAGAFLLWRVLAAIDFTALSGALGALRPWQIAAIVSFPFTTFAIAAFRWRLMLWFVGVPAVPFLKLWTLSFAGACVSLIAPSASVTGDVVKGILLSRGDVARPKAFVSVAIDSFGRFIANTGMSFVLVAAVVLAGPALLRDAQSPALAVPLILGGALIFAIFFRGFFRRSGRIVSLVERLIPNHAQNSTVHEFDAMFAESLRTFRSPAISILVSVVGFAWEVLQAWMILWFLGADVAFFALLLWYLLVTFPRMLPAPGGLGFVEAAGVFAAELFGVPAAFGLGFVLLGRLRDLVILSVGAAALVSGRFGRARVP